MTCFGALLAAYVSTSGVKPVTETPGGPSLQQSSAPPPSLPPAFEPSHGRESKYQFAMPPEEQVDHAMGDGPVGDSFDNYLFADHPDTTALNHTQAPDTQMTEEAPAYDEQTELAEFQMRERELMAQDPDAAAAVEDEDEVYVDKSIVDALKQDKVIQLILSPGHAFMSCVHRLY